MINLLPHTGVSFQNKGDESDDPDGGGSGHLRGDSANRREEAYENSIDFPEFLAIATKRQKESLRNKGGEDG